MSKPNSEDITQLRALPLLPIIINHGAQQDSHDKAKWHTTQGTLTISGHQFYNWNTETGGGGAIDLVIHLQHCTFLEALHWLGHWLGKHAHLHSERQTLTKPESLAASALKLPLCDPTQQWRVKTYLTQERCLPPESITPHLEAASIYADARGNAVFLLHSREGIAVGAELRGTTAAITWRGLAPGTGKNHGYFSTPRLAKAHWPIILCESAIDALSCHALHPHSQCLSISRARSAPAWLRPLLDQGQRIYCGYDADPAGERAAQAMMRLYPQVRRLRPRAKDWNEVLKRPL